jgi:outer membrane protein
MILDRKVMSGLRCANMNHCVRLALPGCLALMVSTSLLLNAAPASATSLPPLVIGYVNLQRAVIEVKEGKRAKDKLKETFEKKQAQLGQKEAELNTLKARLEKESVVKDDEATRKRQAEFQSKLMELQQTFRSEQQALQQAEQEALSGITKKMRDVISEIGKKGQYTLILEVQDSRLLYAKQHLDLTNEVIRNYDKKYN